MPKRLSHSKKTEIPLNPHVRLRVQGDYPLNENDVKKLNAIYNKALNALEVTASELNALLEQLSQVKLIFQLPRSFGYLINKLQKHFNLDLTMPINELTPYIRNIHGSMLKIRKGLLAEKKYSLSLQCFKIPKK